MPVRFRKSVMNIIKQLYGGYLIPVFYGNAAEVRRELQKEFILCNTNGFFFYGEDNICELCGQQDDNCHCFFLNFQPTVYCYWVDPHWPFLIPDICVIINEYLKVVEINATRFVKVIH